MLETHEIATWEKQLVTQRLRAAHRTGGAFDARHDPEDAIPRYIQVNPAARKRGKGRKGQRRIERAEKAEKSWATALEALLFAERCATLSGSDTDFVLAITMAYTGMRWSEVMGLLPELHEATVDIDWKLYELNSRFYRGRPKDGSIRTGRPAAVPGRTPGLASRHQSGAEMHLPKYRAAMVPGR